MKILSLTYQTSPHKRGLRRIYFEIIFIVSCCLCWTALLYADNEQELEASVYKITIEAQCVTENNNIVVDVTGNTDLPGGALIYVFFKRLDNFIASGETAVKDDKFSIRFGPFEKRLLEGEYAIEAVFIPERQPANISELIKDTKDKQKPDLIRATYSLTMGKPEKVQRIKEEVKAEMSSIISELQKLHAELTATYALNKNNFDRQNWNKWSDNWFSKLKKIENKIQDNSQQYLIHLFPKAQENITLAVQNLPRLHQAYSMELKEPEKFAEILKNPDAIAGPQMLNELFRKTLAEAKKEVDSR